MTRERWREEVGWGSEINCILNTEEKFVCGGKFRFVQLVTQSSTLWIHGVLYARTPCPSPTLRAYSNSCPLGRDAIQPSHPLSSPSPPALNRSQHQDLSIESVLDIRWPKHWSFSFSISPSNEHSGLIFFKMDWLDLLAVQGTLKSLLQSHSSKSSIFGYSAFFIVQLLHPYMNDGKIIVFTRWILLAK